MRRDSAPQVALGVLIAALVFLLFDRHAVTGTGYDASSSSASLFAWVRSRWVVTTPYGNDFPHGWLVPLISLAMTFCARRQILAAPHRPSWVGFGVILLALVLLWVGARAQQPRLAALSFVIMAWGIPFHLFGWTVARLLALPCAFLVFTLPFDLLEPFVNRMRAVVTVLSAGLLNGLGLSAQIVDPTTLRLLVEPKAVIALSLQAGGVRSFMYLLMAGVLLAWFRQRSWRHHALLLVAAPAILMLANTARTILQAFGSAALGSRGEQALGSAPLFYGLALALLYGCHRLGDTNWRTFFSKWLRPSRAP